jgi:hypothetical protein
VSQKGRQYRSHPVYSRENVLGPRESGFFSINPENPLFAMCL